MIPGNVINEPVTRPRTLLYNRFWFYPPVMPQVFRQPPVPVTPGKAAVNAQASAKARQFEQGAVDFPSFWEG